MAIENLTSNNAIPDNPKIEKRLTLTNAFILLGCLGFIGLTLFYVNRFAVTFPIGDDSYQIPAAIAAHDGTISLQLLTEQANGFHLVFTKLLTVLSTYISNYDLKVNLYLGVSFSLFNFILLILLFRRYYQKTWKYAAIPIAALVFSIEQDRNWLFTIHNSWHLGVFFFLCALFVLTSPWGLIWRGIAITAVFTFCATFSTASALVCWPLMLPIMWMQGERDWKKYIFWILVAGVGVFAYFSGTGIQFSSTIDQKLNIFSLFSIDQTFLFVLAYLGSPFNDSIADLSFIVGFLAVILFCLDSLYIWRRTRKWYVLAPWLGLAGAAIGGGLLISQARLNWGIYRALSQWYITWGNLFWLALIGLMLTVLPYVWQAKNQKKRLPTLLLNFNLISLSICVVLYGASNLYVFKQTDIGLLGQPTPRTSVATCALNYRFTRGGECLANVLLLDGVRDFIDQLAVRHLSIFKDIAPVSVLPESYQAGEPVIVATSSGWINLYTKDWLLKGVTEQAVWHIVPAAESHVLLQMAYTAKNVSNGEDLTSPPDKLNAAHTIWVLQRDDTTGQKIQTVLTAQGYSAIQIQSNNADLALAQMSILEYTR